MYVYLIVWTDCPFNLCLSLSRRREANLQKGRQLLREGKLSAARDCFNRCVNITPAMAHNLIKVSHIAPYSSWHHSPVTKDFVTNVKKKPVCVSFTCVLFLNQAARARGVDCLVAPYEADAQLAFLTKSGLAEAVITEDSDLLAFGCKKVRPCWSCDFTTNFLVCNLCHLKTKNKKRNSVATTRWSWKWTSTATV